MKMMKSAKEIAQLFDQIMTKHLILEISQEQAKYHKIVEFKSEFLNHITKNKVIHLS